MRLKLGIEYDGTGFKGWQHQPQQRTVEGAVVDALQAMTQQILRVRGASRTDAGVHARGQVAAFSYEGPIQAYQFYRGLNRHLPDDVAVTSVTEVAESFEPRYESLGKRYRYRMSDLYHLSPFERQRAHHVRGRLDVERMHEAAQRLLGEHDYSSFRAADCDAQTPVRNVWRIDVTRHPGGAVELLLEGNAFLKYMVRNLSGTLLEVGTGRRPVEWVSAVLEARDRRAAGLTASACGLVLERVWYADDVDVPLEAIQRASSPG